MCWISLHLLLNYYFLSTSAWNKLIQVFHSPVSDFCYHRNDEIYTKSQFTWYASLQKQLKRLKFIFIMIFIDLRWIFCFFSVFYHINFFCLNVFIVKIYNDRHNLFSLKRVIIDILFHLSEMWLEFLCGILVWYWIIFIACDAFYTRVHKTSLTIIIIIIILLLLFIGNYLFLMWSVLYST